MSGKRPASVGELLSKSSRLNLAGKLTWQVWRDVVGSRVAKRSTPNRLEAGTLFVTVSSSAWAQELSFLSNTIRGKLADKGHAVRALRFVVGDVNLPTRATPSRRVVREELSSELSSRLERLEDPKLRELIAEAASYRVKNDG